MKVTVGKDVGFIDGDAVGLNVGLTLGSFVGEYVGLTSIKSRFSQHLFSRSCYHNARRKGW